MRLSPILCALTSMLTIFSTTAFSSPLLPPFLATQIVTIDSPPPYYPGVAVNPYQVTVDWGASSDPTSLGDSITIDWGDGSAPASNTVGLPLATSGSTSMTVGGHFYIDPGTYTVYITGTITAVINDVSYTGGVLVTDESLVISSPTPIPSASLLFASGVGALSLLFRRRKRKAAALAA
jgi:hypothetical protein